jgi:hypothetical protein
MRVEILENEGEDTSDIGSVGGWKYEQRLGKPLVTGRTSRIKMRAKKKQRVQKTLVVEEEVGWTTGGGRSRCGEEHRYWKALVRKFKRRSRRRKTNPATYLHRKTIILSVRLSSSL